MSDCLEIDGIMFPGIPFDLEEQREKLRKKSEELHLVHGNDWAQVAEKEIEKDGVKDHYSEMTQSDILYWWKFIIKFEKKYDV